MNKILQDENLNTFLEKEGFVVLPLLNDQEIKILKELYNKWHPTPPEEFYKSYFSQNKEYKKEVEELVLSIVAPKLDTFFCNYIPFGGMFVVKPSGPKGYFPLHQDWSFVDERQHWSLNMWLPLQDVDSMNGNMQMLRGSHRFIHTIRGSGTPSQYENQREMLGKYATDIPMKAGEAIFFFHGMLHGSSPNVSEKERVSISLSMVEKDVPIYYHYRHPSTGQTEEFLASVDFFINYVSERDELPTSLKSGGFTDFTFSIMADEDLLVKVNAANKSDF